MIKRLLTIYLPAAAVLTTATLAAVFLYNDVDPELNDVEFVRAEKVEELSSEELRITNDELWEDETESDVSVETQHVASQSDGVAEEPSREQIRSASSQTEPVIVTASGPGVSIRCEILITETVMAHQVMRQAADQCNFGYQTKQYASLGVFVDGIAGVMSDTNAGMYWIFSVNGVKANVGVSSYQLQPGDELSWKYEQEY